MNLNEHLYASIFSKLNMSEEVTDDELQKIIYQEIKDYGKTQYLPFQERLNISTELFNAFRKLDIIQELLEDDTITEIMINGIDNIFVERQGRITKLEKKFWSQEKLENVIQQIVAGSNRIINESSPIVDARLKDGSRVNIVLNPIAINGPIITIRKFFKESITMEKLVKWGSITTEAAEFLKILVKSRYNIFISGGTGSGKTTFLNALSEHIPKHERIITIEDNAELQLRSIPNLVQLEARMPNVEGEGEITIRDLIKSSLRMRPNRIIVGEVRGSEVIDMLMAMNTGHDGSLSTAHANTPQDMISRLETMVLMGMDIPLKAVQKQIVSAIDIMVHVGRLRDGTRKVLEISEIKKFQHDVELNTLYKFREERVVNEKIIGTLQLQNKLQNIQKLLDAGYQVI